MKQQLTILAKSEKHGGFCVAALNDKNNIIRLVRDEEGHALSEEVCRFSRLDTITAETIYKPLEHQKENHILGEIYDKKKSNYDISKLRKLVEKPRHIFKNTERFLTEEEMKNITSTFAFVEVSDIHIYENDEEKQKIDFVYNGKEYKAFAITDPKFKVKERNIPKALILVSLPNTPFAKYGKDLYYKFVSAVYPINENKAFDLSAYKI